MALSKELDKVQKTIIHIHREFFGESLSPMKLQKLCYYAQAFALAKGDLIFSEDFHAWTYGPVIRNLYFEYKDFGWRQITSEINLEDLLQVDSQEYNHIQEVVEAYGRFDGAALSTMTHREDPWLLARGDIPEIAGSNAIISKQSIAEYFAAKIRENG